MAFSYIQSKSANANSAVPSVTLTNAPISGNLLIAAIASAAASAPTLAGWTPLTSITAGTGGSSRAMRLFYKISDGSEQTVTGAASSQLWTMIVAEYSGSASVSALDIDNSIATVSGNTHTTPAVTPTSSVNRLVILVTMVRATATWTSEQINSSATGVNEREDANFFPGAQLSELEVASTSGTYTGVATSSGSAAVGIAAIAIFKPAPVSASIPNKVYKYNQAVNRASTY